MVPQMDRYVIGGTVGDPFRVHLWSARNGWDRCGSCVRPGNGPYFVWWDKESPRMGFQVDRVLQTGRIRVQILSHIGACKRPRNGPGTTKDPNLYPKVDHTLVLGQQGTRKWTVSIFGSPRGLFVDPKMDPGTI